MKKIIAVVAVVLMATGVSFASSKKSASVEKLGLGFNTQVDAVLPALSVRYWTAGNYGFEGILGWAQTDIAGKTNTNTIIGAKYLSNIKSEKFANVYWLAMVASKSIGGASGTVIGAGLGVEFFFEELPNLGFGSEIYLASDSTENCKITGLTGAPVTASLRYYFQ